MKLLRQMGKYPQSEELYFDIIRSSFFLSASPFYKGFFTLYSSFQIILTLHLSFIWDFTWVFVPSTTSSSFLWVVITKVSLFRCFLHINTARKVVTVYLMRWQQLFLRSFGLSHLPFKSIGHVIRSLSFLEGSSSCWDANLRYDSHVREDFHPQTPLHMLLTYGALCWAFIMYWQSPRIVYCPQTGPMA